MVSGEISVRRLHPREVKLTLHDINALLRQQHSKAKKIGDERLCACLKESIVVVAWDFRERVVGMGVLVTPDVLSYTFASIHHLVVWRGGDKLIRKQILDELLAHAPKVEFIKIEVLPDDDELLTIVKTLGFKPHKKFLYRLKR